MQQSFTKIDFSTATRISLTMTAVAFLLIAFILRYSPASMRGYKFLLAQIALWPVAAVESMGSMYDVYATDDEIFVFVCRIPIPAWTYALLTFVPLFAILTVFVGSFAYRFEAMHIGAKSNFYQWFEASARSMPTIIFYLSLTVIIAVLSLPISILLSLLIVYDIPLDPDILHAIESLSGLDRSHISPIRFGQVYWSRFFVAGCCAAAMALYAIPLCLIVYCCFRRMKSLGSLSLSSRTLEQHRIFVNLLICELLMEMAILSIDMAGFLFLIFNPQIFVIIYPILLSVVSTQSLAEFFILLWFLAPYRRVIAGWLRRCLPNRIAHRFSLQNISIIDVKTNASGLYE